LDWIQLAQDSPHRRKWRIFYFCPRFNIWLYFHRFSVYEAQLARSRQRAVRHCDPLEGRCCATMVHDVSARFRLVTRSIQTRNELPINVKWGKMDYSYLWELILHKFPNNYYLQLGFQTLALPPLAQNS
jgi:hypothetical protein